MNAAPPLKTFAEEAPGPEPIFSMRSSPRAALIHQAFGKGLDRSRRAVIFTSPEPGAGVSWIACAVADDLAAAGRKVLLVDALVLHSLSDEENIVALCKQVTGGKAWVLSSTQARFAKGPHAVAHKDPAILLAALLHEFAHVVIDAPALSASSVALQLAPAVAGSVLLVREGKTTKRNFQQAVHSITSVGGTIIGCVYKSSHHTR